MDSDWVNLGSKLVKLGRIEVEMGNIGSVWVKIIGVQIDEIGSKLIKLGRFGLRRPGIGVKMGKIG